MKYVGLYSDPQDIAVKKNVDAVADRVTTAEGEIDALQTAVDNKVSKAGDTMTGDLTVGSAQIQTNGYVTGTWLKGTAANHLTTAATKIAVQDSSGWIYHRTPSEILSDIGALPDTTVIPTVPDNLVTYAAGTTVEAVTGVDADTLQGHAASYFATQSALTAANTSISTNANNITELSTKVSSVEGSISGIQTSVSNKLDKSGGTMTGALVAQNNTNYTTKQVRNIIISTAAPSGGSNGDIWIQYTV